MTRGANLTEAQLRRLMQQAPTNPQAAKVAARGLYESDIETTIVAAMERDGWRAFKMEYNFDRIKKLTLGEPGMCDHLFIRYGDGDRLEFPTSSGLKVVAVLKAPAAQVLWWEFKASKRRRKRAEYVSADQATWTDGEKARGALVWIAGIDHEATIDGAAQHYLDSGLARRRELFVALIPPEGRALPDRDRRLGDG